MSGLSVLTNVQSLIAQKALRKNTGDLQSNLEKLSTGYRINSAKDDAAGLSIGSKFSTEIQGLDKAMQNIGDAKSVAETLGGALGVIQASMQRIRELYVQGINGTNSPEDRGAIQNEINQRVTLIDDVSKSTKFNGLDLLANPIDKVFQTGAGSGESTTLKLSAGINANQGIDVDISYVNNATATDYGQLVENATAGFALDRLYIPNSTVNSLNYGTHTTNVSPTLSDIDKVIENLSRISSYVGGVSNALDSTLENNDIYKQSHQASRSRILDTDIASETASLAANQILQQSATSMLVQANSSTKIALQLLQ